MVGSLCVPATVLVLLPAVTAARIRGGGGSSSSSSSSSGSADDSSFDAPPLEIANLVVYCLLLFGTLIQLASTFPALLRSGTRLPAAGAVMALTILTIGYVLGVALIATSGVVDGFQRIPVLPSIDLHLAASLFFDWADPAIFAAVAILLRSRYRTVQKSSSGALIGFSIAASVLFVMMVILIAADSGLASAAFATVLSSRLLFDEFKDRIQTSNNIFYAFIAFHVISTLFLATSAFLVNAHTKKDRIMSLTLFGIIPLLVLHAIARLISAIVQALLPFLDGFGSDVEYELDFASTLVFGVLHLAAMAILVYILARPSLWSAKPTAQDAPGLGAPPPQFFAQGVPPAQFPGQWGYPQQPQGPYQQQAQYGYPQQYAYVPVYPMQVPGTQMQMQMQPPETEMAQGSPQPPPTTAQA